MAIKDDSGQLYTMEGITAALILLGVLFFVIEANSIVAPQTVKSLDMKLGQMAEDALTSVNWNDADSWSTNESLTEAVAAWDPDNGTTASMGTLNNVLMPMFPNYTQYNVQVEYMDHGVMNSSMAIYNGPYGGDNSTMSATKIVTLNPDDNLSPYWRNTNRFTLPEVVTVRLSCWYI